MSFVKDDEVLSYFSMVTTVGTPQTIAAQELRIECMFPADDVTETRHVAIAWQGSGGVRKNYIRHARLDELSEVLSNRPRCLSTPPRPPR
jgi:hypothetical protein